MNWQDEQKKVATGVTGEQEPVELDVTLDEKAVEILHAFSSSSSSSFDDYSKLRLMLGEGHSGHGLYLSLAEYPEEGSELLVNTHPKPKREWVGLTDVEKYALCKQFPFNLTFDAIFAIETKLKEKNT
jgi:hypothetical protein